MVSMDTAVANKEHGGEESSGHDLGVVDAYPAFQKGCSSLLSQVLTPALYHRCKRAETGMGTTLSDCIVGGVYIQSHPIGLLAADAESYVLFGDVFTPVITALHPRFDASFGWQHPHDASLPGLLLDDPDPWNQYVTSVRVSAARNIEGVRLAPGMTIGDRQKVQTAVSEACGRHLGGVSGVVRPCGDILGNSVLTSKLDALGLLPSSSGQDPYKVASHTADHWPVGRAVWYSEDLRLAVWMNDEDHIRVTATEEIPAEDGDASEATSAAFARVFVTLAELARSLPFETNDRLGFITTSPALLGTAMRVTVAVKNLKNLGSRVNDVCEELFMKAQDLGNGAFLVSSEETLGISEVNTVRETMDCVAELIKLEKRLEKVMKHEANATAGLRRKMRASKMRGGSG